MKQNRIPGLLLAVIICLGCMTIPAAAAEASEETILEILSILEVMNGDENGELHLTRNVTRAEFVKLVISASPYKDAGTGTTQYSPFSDVRSDHWASGYIKVAVDAGLIAGYLDGTFKPDSTVKLEEAVTVVLKLLGYTDEDFTGGYPSGQLSLYKSLKLDDNISSSAGSYMRRVQCAHLIYNTMLAPTKAGAMYADSLGLSLDPEGEIDYLSLINSKMDGPIIFSPGESLTARIGFIPRLVYRDGKLSSLSAVSPYDVVYYLDKSSTVWISSKKVYGIYESALPDLTSPQQITVSGKAAPYTIGTSEASLALSAIGSFRIGDNITLLLGLDDKIAGVIMTSDNTDSIVCGVVSDTGKKSFTDQDGSSYSSYYVQVTTTGEGVFEYPVSDDKLEKGDIVSVSFSGSVPVVKEIPRGGDKVSGRVSKDYTKLGDYYFADDVEIMDLYSVSPAFVRPERLKGAQINESSVLYASFNTAGEISRLILNDVTGDMHTYGVIYDITEVEFELNLNTTFKYHSGGTEENIMSASKIFRELKLGPFYMKRDFSKPDPKTSTPFKIDQVQNLPVTVTLSELSETTARSRSQSFTVPYDVQVYIRGERKEFFPSSVLHITANPDDYTIQGFLDKQESQGGRIRVILATPK